MFNIISHWGNANQNHGEAAIYTHEEGYNKKNRKTSVGEDMEKLEPSYVS